MAARSRAASVTSAVIRSKAHFWFHVRIASTATSAPLMIVERATPALGSSGILAPQELLRYLIEPLAVFRPFLFAALALFLQVRGELFGDLDYHVPVELAFDGILGVFLGQPRLE